MERALASIRNIHELVPIEGADFIEIAKIDGWQCVVKKGEFVVGDKCVYFEIDSLLPVIEEFSFLAKSGTKTSEDGSVGYRLRTIKLKGQLSQGLALPISVFNLDSEIELETDITEILGIKKYEKPLPTSLQNIAKGNFTIEIPKTDENRIQNLSRLFKEHLTKETVFRVTEKLDGSSGTFYLKDGIFGACSRNYDLEYDENSIWWKVAEQSQIESKLREYAQGRNIAIQGEIVGSSIQGNPYKFKDCINFYMFNFYDIDNQKFSTEDYHNFTNIDKVPFLSEYKLSDFVSVEKILEYAEGKSHLNPDTEREGVVFSSYDKTVSFKAISNKFLLKEKDL